MVVLKLLSEVAPASTLEKVSYIKKLLSIYPTPSNPLFLGRFRLRDFLTRLSQVVASCNLSVTVSFPKM